MTKDTKELNKNIRKAKIMMIVSFISLVLVIGSFFISRLAVRYFTLSLGVLLSTISYAVDVHSSHKMFKLILTIILAIFAVLFLILGIIELMK